MKLRILPPLILASSLSVFAAEIIEPPVNDDFENAKVLIGDGSPQLAVLYGATKQLGEPEVSGFNTVWWKYAPTSIGRITLALSSSDPFLRKSIAVFFGDRVNELTQIASVADASTSPSLLSLPVAPGQVYYISTGTTFERTSAADSRIQVSVLLNTKADISDAPIQSPPSVNNDDYSQRAIVSGKAWAAIGYNSDATSEASTFEPDPAGKRTLWWSYTPPHTGRLTVSLVGSDDFSKNLSLFLGNELSSLRIIANIIDIQSANSGIIAFPVTAGTEYSICVGSYATSGGGSIVISGTLDADSDLSDQKIDLPAMAANDRFSRRGLILGSTETVIGYNYLATREPQEPSDPEVFGSLWWSWTASASGQTSIDFSGSDNQRKRVGVWKGPNLQSLQKVAAVDAIDDNKPAVSFQATAGETYHIAVGNANTQRTGGSIVMTITGQVGSGASIAPILRESRALKIEWFGISGARYQVQKSFDGKTWMNVGGIVTGAGSRESYFEEADAPLAVLRVVVL